MAKKASGSGKKVNVKLVAQKRFVGSEGQRALITYIEGNANAVVAFKLATDEVTDKGNVKYARVFANRVDKAEGARAFDTACKKATAQGWVAQSGRSRAMGVEGEIPEA